MCSERYDGMLIELSKSKTMNFVWFHECFQSFLRAPGNKPGEGKTIHFTMDETKVLYELKHQIMPCVEELNGSRYTSAENYFSRMNRWTDQSTSNKLKEELGYDLISKTKDGGYRIKLSQTKQIVLKLFKDNVYGHVWDNKNIHLVPVQEQKGVCISLNYEDLYSLMENKNEVSKFIFTDCVEDMPRKYWQFG